MLNKIEEKRKMLTKRPLFSAKNDSFWAVLLQFVQFCERKARERIVKKEWGPPKTSEWILVISILVKAPQTRCKDLQRHSTSLGGSSSWDVRHSVFSENPKFAYVWHTTSALRAKVADFDYRRKETRHITGVLVGVSLHSYFPTRQPRSKIVKNCTLPKMLNYTVWRGVVQEDKVKSCLRRFVNSPPEREIPQSILGTFVFFITTSFEHKTIPFRPGFVNKPVLHMPLVASNRGQDTLSSMVCTTEAKISHKICDDLLEGFLRDPPPKWNKLDSRCRL